MRAGTSTQVVDLLSMIGAPSSLVTNSCTRGGDKFTKEQIMVDTNKFMKAGALWQTLRLYYASYDK